MTAASRDRFAATVRTRPVDLALACLLIAVETDPGLDVDRELRALDGLAADVAARSPGLGPATPPDEAAAALRAALGPDGAGFVLRPEAYDGLAGSLLPVVLERRTGLPILLSVVWLEVARRLGLPAFGVGLPGHFLVALGHPGGRCRLADPASGGRLLDPVEAAALAAEASGRSGPGVDVPAVLAELAEPGSDADLLTRVLANIRASTGAGLDGARTRLWATELALLTPAHALGLRRERGLLRARLGDHRGGYADLDAYADAIAAVDETAAASARRQARAVLALLN